MVFVSSAHRDHPRACGEQLASTPPPWDYVGSSPRVRGAVPDPLRDCEPVGIIPARAGSSLREVRHTSLMRDHPRACGEQYPPNVPL